MKIAIGTANFGQNYGLRGKNIKSLPDIKKILKISNLSKIKIIDTSQNYGLSESLLGKNNLNNFKIITKIKFLFKKKNKNLENILFKKIKESLIKLKIKKLYGVLLHRSDDLKGKKKYELIKILKKMKKKKLTSKIGISIYDPKELDLIWTIWKPDIVQCPFNILDRRIYESGWLDILKKNNVEIHVRSIFLQGLLLKDYRYIPKKFSKWKNVLKKWCNYCKKENVSKLDVCINFIKSFKKISFVIIGFEDVNQVKKIIGSFDSNRKKNYTSLSSNNIKLIDPRLW